MDGQWVCGSCHSINRPATSRCYSCHQSRTETEAPSADDEASAPGRLLGLGGAVAMACPACGTTRLGWSSRCRSCGLSFDKQALAQVGAAAAQGPSSLARLLLQRLPVLIPGLLLLVVVLVIAALLPPR